MSGKSPAATHVLAILDFLSHGKGPVPAAVIARALGIPRSTTYQLLESLSDRGFAIHFPSERTWGLGVRAFEIGSGYAKQQPLVLVSAQLLRQLAQDLQMGSHLAVLHGLDVIYLVEERSSHGPWLVSDVGVRLPAHLTATGRAILAHLPKNQMRALYPDGAAPLPVRHSHGPKSVRELRDLLQQTRQRGWSIEDEEISPGFFSVATVIRDYTGWPAAAIALTGAKEKVESAIPALAQRLMQVATIIETRLGGTGGASTL
jgi:DNA-binding IclR family transcriptional regulator